MENSSRYRKPPLKRTRDSFIDDTNLQTNRADFSQNRHLEVRRDKDKTRSLGITLYDVDFAIKSFIDKSIQLRIEDNGESIQVPTIYANSEKWASIQKDGFLKDKKGKTLAPLISFKRSNVLIKPEMKRNKVATTDQLAYFMQQKYNKLMPYDKFSILYDKRKSRDYFITPIPDYVDITYNFVIWCEYQHQLNYILENFVFFGGQSFGEKNFFKFSTNLDNLLMEESNITGQDRLIRANFDLLVHAYLIPKEAANQVTTKRVVSPNKILFGAETFSSIDDILQMDSDTDSDLSNRGNIGITVRDQ
jgi:hypothetical protein